eukprot:gene2352-3080_t
MDPIAAEGTGRLTAHRVVAVAVVASEEAASCPNGWLCADGMAYKYFSDPATWQVAQMYCHGLGGSLATIETAAQNALVAGHVGLNYTWLGLVNDAVPPSEDWRWIENNASVCNASASCSEATDNGRETNYGGYAKWAATQIPNSDSSSPLVISADLCGQMMGPGCDDWDEDSPSIGAWVARDCAEPRPFTCSVRVGPQWTPSGRSPARPLKKAAREPVRLAGFEYATRWYGSRCQNGVCIDAFDGTPGDSPWTHCNGVCAYNDNTVSFSDKYDPSDREECQARCEGDQACTAYEWHANETSRCKLVEAPVNQCAASPDEADCYLKGCNWTSYLEEYSDVIGLGSTESHAEWYWYNYGKAAGHSCTTSGHRGDPEPVIVVYNGECTITGGGRCMAGPGYPERHGYGDSGYCSAVITPPAGGELSSWYLNSKAFDISTIDDSVDDDYGYDYYGYSLLETYSHTYETYIQFTGENGPNDVAVDIGNGQWYFNYYWSSSESGSLFEVCLEQGAVAMTCSLCTNPASELLGDNQAGSHCLSSDGQMIYNADGSEFPTLEACQSGGGETMAPYTCKEAQQSLDSTTLEPLACLTSRNRWIAACCARAGHTRYKELAG